MEKAKSLHRPGLRTRPSGPLGAAPGSVCERPPLVGFGQRLASTAGAFMGEACEQHTTQLRELLRHLQQCRAALLKQEPARYFGLAPPEDGERDMAVAGTPLAPMTLAEAAPSPEREAEVCESGACPQAAPVCSAHPPSQRPAHVPDPPAAPPSAAPTGPAGASAPTRAACALPHVASVVGGAACAVPGDGPNALESTAPPRPAELPRLFSHTAIELSAASAGLPDEPSAHEPAVAALCARAGVVAVATALHVDLWQCPHAAPGAHASHICRVPLRDVAAHAGVAAAPGARLVCVGLGLGPCDGEAAAAGEGSDGRGARVELALALACTDPDADEVASARPPSAPRAVGARSAASCALAVCEIDGGSRTSVVRVSGAAPAAEAGLEPGAQAPCVELALPGVGGSVLASAPCAVCAWQPWQPETRPAQPPAHRARVAPRALLRARQLPRAPWMPVRRGHPPDAPARSAAPALAAPGPAACALLVPSWRPSWVLGVCARGAALWDHERGSLLLSFADGAAAGPSAQLAMPSPAAHAEATVVFAPFVPHDAHEAGLLSRAAAAAEAAAAHAARAGAHTPWAAGRAHGEQPTRRTEAAAGLTTPAPRAAARRGVGAALVAFYVGLGAHSARARGDSGAAAERADAESPTPPAGPFWRRLGAGADGAGACAPYAVHLVACSSDALVSLGRYQPPPAMLEAAPSAAAAAPPAAAGSHDQPSGARPCALRWDGLCSTAELLVGVSARAACACVWDVRSRQCVALVREPAVATPRLALGLWGLLGAPAAGGPAAPASASAVALWCVAARRGADGGRAAEGGAAVLHVLPCARGVGNERKRVRPPEPAAVSREPAVLAPSNVAPGGARGSGCGGQAALAPAGSGRKRSPTGAGPCSRQLPSQPGHGVSQPGSCARGAPVGAAPSAGPAPAFAAAGLGSGTPIAGGCGFSTARGTAVRMSAAAMQRAQAMMLECLAADDDGEPPA